MEDIIDSGATPHLLHTGPEEGGEKQRASLRVLLVEDQAELRDLLADVLQDSGIDVRTAVNVESAMQALEDYPCDVLFSDIHMPGQGNGIDLARHVMATKPSARVILASGHPRPQLPALPGPALFLQKPFRLAQFMALLPV